MPKWLNEWEGVLIRGGGISFLLCTRGDSASEGNVRARERASYVDKKHPDEGCGSKNKTTSERKIPGTAGKVYILQV